MKTLRPYQLEALNNLKIALKNHKEPVLVTASVGAGKSLIIAECIKWLVSHKKRVLCLTMNSSLIEQNAKTYEEQQGKSGIYCSGLKSKQTTEMVIFASPHSIVQGIRSKTKISKVSFDCVIVDEAHNIHPHDKYTMYWRIFLHYSMLCQERQCNFRIVGLTGTPYRGKNESIVGEHAFFKHEVCNINATWLIQNGYLTRPVFGDPPEQSIDFSKVRMTNMGKFNNSDLQKVINKNRRLTFEILQEVLMIMQTRVGAFIFASTTKHCQECIEALGEHQSAIITAKTPHLERKKILEDARSGKIKFLINVNCLTVGVDVPTFDTAVFLRPTESLVLYTQAVGRVLRLAKDKEEALILDYAGNVERFGDMDDAIINEANQPKEKNQHEFVIPCQSCGTKNTEHARRCIGVQDKKRCDYYFEWKECENCEAQNDIVARVCRNCQKELIDPNNKLKTKASNLQTQIMKVTSMQWFFRNETQLIVLYRNDTQIFSETFYLSSEKAQRYTYGVFFKKHYEHASDFYLFMKHPKALQSAMSKRYPECPYEIEISNGKIIKKHF